jgi:hypothetical protein
VCSMSKNGAGDVETLLDGGGGTGDDGPSNLVLTVAWFPSIEPPNLAPSKWLWTLDVDLIPRSRADASAFGTVVEGNFLGGGGGLCMSELPRV